MKKTFKTILFIILTSLLLLIGACSSSEEDNAEADTATIEILDKNKEDTTTYEDEDFVYEPKDDDISYDEDAEVYFYNNLLNVYLDSAVSEEEAIELADKIDGDVVGLVQGDVNALQLQVEAELYDELSQLADEYKAEDLVKLASPSTPMYTSQTEAKEENTSLEEFVETSSISDFIEKNEDNFDPVTVGMVEVEESTDEDKETFSNRLNANKNEIDLVTIQFNDKEAKENKENKAVTELKIITEIKEQLKDDATIINNSFKNQVKSEEKYEAENETEISYESYLNANENVADIVSAQLIIGLDDFLNSENNDFLLIQEVGKGYQLAEDEKDTEAEFNAEQAGYFANINERTYELAEELNQEKLDNDLTDMLNQIIVVGETEEIENIHYGDVVDIVSPSGSDVVSSAVALIQSYNPEMKANEVKVELLSSSMDEVATKNKENDETTYPIVNLAGFMYAETVKNYDDLLETYQTAITEQWGYEQLHEKDIGPYADERQSIPNDYGYEFKDINRNGKPELILGDDQFIQEIYTLVNNKPEKIVTGYLRSEINILHDGTIIDSNLSPGSGEITETLFELLEDGSKKEIESYTYPFTEERSKDYDEGDMISHSFKKIVSKEADETQGKEEEKAESKVEDKEKDTEEALTDDEIKDIMTENYNEIEAALNNLPLNNLFDQYHDYQDGEEIWISGVNSETPFYKDVHALFYPKVKDLVTDKAGMKFLIDQKFADFHNPAGISTFTPFDDLEILSKEIDTFEIKQIIEQQQDVEISYYEFILNYKKEDGKWKLADGEDVSDWQPGQ